MSLALDKLPHDISKISGGGSCYLLLFGKIAPNFQSYLFFLPKRSKTCARLFSYSVCFSGLFVCFVVFFNFKRALFFLPVCKLYAQFQFLRALNEINSGKLPTL